ncbi:class I SAM-dependent methyltransferase, partial [Flavobacteriaceae bacterium]|nr:class I SAM-dependent methyltransferase [Flavobacteriaceae bacterium]
SKETFEIKWSEKCNYAETSLPKDILLSRYYETDNYNSHKTETKSFLDLLYKTVQKSMLYYKAGFIRPRIKGNVLDVGGGVGVFAAYLAHKKFEITVVEPNKKGLEACTKKGLNTYLSVADLPTNKRYSATTMWHVLEHLMAPEKTLQELRALMETDALLIIAVPNFNSHDARYYGSEWAALDVPRHLWHFTHKGLIDLVEPLGFVVIAQKPLWFDVFYISYLSEKNRRKKLPFLRGLLVGTICTFRALIDGEHSSNIYVFKKKTIH